MELGSRLAQPYWGQGFATEAALAWARAGFDEFHVDRLGAFVHPENVASIRVLEKLGFLAERRDTVKGMDSMVFFLDASRCKAPRAGASHRHGAGQAKARGPGFGCACTLDPSPAPSASRAPFPRLPTPRARPGR